MSAVIFSFIRIYVYTSARLFRYFSVAEDGARGSSGPLQVRSLGAPAESGLLSNQGAKSIHFYFIMVPLRKKD